MLLSRHRNAKYISMGLYRFAMETHFFIIFVDAF